MTEFYESQSNSSDKEIRVVASSIECHSNQTTSEYLICILNIYEVCILKYKIKISRIANNPSDPYNLVDTTSALFKAFLLKILTLNNLSFPKRTLEISTNCRVA